MVILGGVSKASTSARKEKEAVMRVVAVVKTIVVVVFLFVVEMVMF